MRRASIMAACLFAAAFAGVAADQSGVVTSAALVKTTFLSTEDAQAQIAVFNDTPAQITVDTGDIMFHIASHGQWESRRACNRDCWRWFRRVAPGARAEVNIGLPACEVLSDRCSEQVVMDYPIVIGQEHHVYTASLPAYRFIPDPNAVYRNVKGAIPVLVAFGTASGTVAPSAVAIGVVAAPSTPFNPNSPPAEPFAKVAKFLGAEGIQIYNQTVELDNDAWYLNDVGAGGYMHVPYGQKANTWRATFTTRYVSEERVAKINAALSAIRQRFGTQLSKVWARVVIDPGSDESDLWRAAQDNAEPQAQRLLALIGGRELDPTSTGLTAGYLSFPNAAAAHYDPMTETDLDAVQRLTPLQVVGTAQIGYQGTQPANVRIDPAVAARARQAFRSPFAMPTLAPAAEMAVDRPEIYAAGSASTRASLRAGLAPEAVALLNARIRTEEFAGLVGVRLGQESLFALYNPGGIGDPTLGVATTFSGGDARASVSSVTDPQVRLFRNTNPDARKSIPIDIPSPQTTITESTWAETRVDARLLRFEMEADGNEAPPDVDAGRINAQLRAVPGVLATALTTQYMGQNVRFEVLLPRSKRSLIFRLAAIVQGAYKMPAAYTSFTLAPFVGDCATIERRLLKVTVHQNWIGAQADARASHRTLRKLLLAAVFPTGEGSACYPLARDPSGLEPRSVAEIPSALPPAAFSTSSLLVFRTR